MIFCFKCGHSYEDLNSHICSEETAEEFGKRLAKESVAIIEKALEKKE